MTARSSLLFLYLSVSCGTASPAVQPEPVEEVGRYWARFQATAAATETNMEVWFELKPAAIPDWTSAETTPTQVIPARTAGQDASLTIIEDWVSGLEPDTLYEMRPCYRRGTAEVVCSDPESFSTTTATLLRWVGTDPTSPKHLAFEDGERFHVWGNNFVHPDAAQRHNDLVEDLMYDDEGLALIATDFDKLSNLKPPDGTANAIRMHLQLHEFLLDAATPNRKAYATFARVIELAEDRSLYVMVTGLNYFYPPDNPLWIAEQNDDEHWATQALWWKHMASALRHSPGVMAYDLVNEPYATGGSLLVDGYSQWSQVAPDEYCAYASNPDLGINGICFGQFVTATATSTPPAEIAAEWTETMRQAIRSSGSVDNDARHLITVGVGGAFGLNNVFNSSSGVHAAVDFVSPHLYPKGEDNGQSMLDLASALSSTTGKPVIVGETFTLGPVEHLISQACNDGTVQGWFGQYDGRTRDDACHKTGVFGCAFHDLWYDIFGAFGPTIRSGDCPDIVP